MLYDQALREDIFVEAKGTDREIVITMIQPKHDNDLAYRLTSKDPAFSLNYAH